LDRSGARAALYTREGEIRLYDLVRGALERTFRPPERTHLLAFSPDGSLLGSTRYGRVDAWDARTGAHRASASGSALGLAFDSVDAPRFVVAEWGRVSVQPGNRTLSTAVAGGDSLRPVLSPSGRAIIWTGSLGGKLAIDVRGRGRRTAPEPDEACAFSPD